MHGGAPNTSEITALAQSRTTLPHETSAREVRDLCGYHQHMTIRFIDLAIFGSLGALWVAGFGFIVLLYRWIRNYERERE
jgi:nitrate reductase NapE component